MIPRKVAQFQFHSRSARTGTMGDYGWSMDSDTPQGIDAVEYGRVLEYPKRRNKISDHEKARSLQINRVRIGSSFLGLNYM